MDGKTSWLRLWHHTACSEPLSRLDIQLSGSEPRLDAAHCMGDLTQQAAPKACFLNEWPPRNETLTVGYTDAGVSSGVVFLEKG
ncbi:uncharacterized protein ATNIH1004_001761 [Aspergillus tanneri]|uniref:Uncharacterized protein n=1 Tax=Aspergillus tanneri TaxID=1220188 RepID=A0A5M9N0K1_9EURO|nr:uncharacterized protein ATNIH1004_001761 [Aspergillus tanneri]KAA8652852.1 hypothetical protein ATNIH1004_001761 [Aspergillus tanneri]